MELETPILLLHAVNVTANDIIMKALIEMRIIELILFSQTLQN